MRFYSKVLFIGIVLVSILNAKEPASIETAIGAGSGILVGKNPEMALPSNFGWNVSAGASLDFPVSEKFSLLAGLDLDYLDFRSKIKMTSGNESFEKSDVAAILDLNIPVLIRAKFGKRFFASGGIAPSFNILSKRKKVFESWSDISGMQKFNAEIVLEAGIRLPCRFASNVRFEVPVFETLESPSGGSRLRTSKILLGISRQWGNFSF